AGVNPASVVTSPAAAPKLPQERIKRSYDEAGFRELDITMQSTSESRLAKLDPGTHAAYHLQRGRDFLATGLAAQAEKQLREAVELTPGNALARACLADALDQNHDAAGARAESDAALRLAPSTEVYLVLARVNLRDNNKQGASELLQQALRLDPANAEALALERKLTGQGVAAPQRAIKP
ncbi:MAG TPA: hypothetical protein VFU27_08060, partial [Terriglobales bacterium]|nr:hypothetical protein [Terriglobales bacterium]